MSEIVNPDHPLLISKKNDLITRDEIKKIRCLNAFDALFNSKYDDLAKYGLDKEKIINHISTINRLKSTIIKTDEPLMKNLVQNFNNLSDFLYTNCTIENYNSYTIINNLFKIALQEFKTKDKICIVETTDIGEEGLYLAERILREEIKPPEKILPIERLKTQVDQDYLFLYFFLEENLSKPEYFRYTQIWKDSPAVYFLPFKIGGRPDEERQATTVGSVSSAKKHKISIEDALREADIPQELLNDVRISAQKFLITQKKTSIRKYVDEYDLANTGTSYEIKKLHSPSDFTELFFKKICNIENLPTAFFSKQNYIQIASYIFDISEFYNMIYTFPIVPVTIDLNEYFKI